MNRAVIIAIKISGAMNRNVRRLNRASLPPKLPNRQQPARAANSRTRIDFFSAP